MSGPTPRTVSAFLIRVVIFAALWFGVAEGRLESWPIALPAALSAAGLDLALSGRRRWRWRPGPTARFAGYFLVHALRAGIDVARRAWSVPLRLAPQILTCSVDLPPGPPRVLFVNTVNLLPGTLIAELRGDRLTVHTLDVQPHLEADFARLQGLVAAVFGLEPGAEESTEAP